MALERSANLLLSIKLVGIFALVFRDNQSNNSINNSNTRFHYGKFRHE